MFKNFFRAIPAVNFPRRIGRFSNEFTPFHSEDNMPVHMAEGWWGKIIEKIPSVLEKAQREWLIRIGLVFLFAAYAFSQNTLHGEDSKISTLGDLEAQVRRDLNRINLPAKPWLDFSPSTKGEEVIDVAIIGGGMAGMTAGFALIKEGITEIKIFDENVAGEEGPWGKYARMKHLRSNKALMGPALGISSLTFHSWFEARYGNEAWRQMKQVPTLLWNEYLHWYRQVLKLPVINHMALLSINPVDGLLELIFDKEGQKHTVYARKVILATGREGFGGKEIPAYIEQLPKKIYAHTNEKIDSSNLAKKRVVVIGGGAAAFDAIAFALESGACCVDMLIRRKQIPSVNKYSRFTFPGMFHGFFTLSDEMRCCFFADALEHGIPPPKEAVERVKNFDNLSIKFNVSVQQMTQLGETLSIRTNQGDIESDFVIFATGYAVDGFHCLELERFIDKILLWESRVPPEMLEKTPMLGRFPYLGSHFQFLEKIEGQAPYLKHIYCFNYGAFLSHGLISGEIYGISIGAIRLAQGIAADFFNEECKRYWQ